MSNLLKRTISAVIFLIGVLLIYNYWSAQGVFVLGTALCSLGAWEYRKLAFNEIALPKIFSYWFFLVCFALIIVTLHVNYKLLIIWGIILTTFVSVSLWIFRNNTQNETILRAVSLSLLGFLYCAMLPTPALLLFRLPDGHLWFIFLLAVVFAGDIFAYFGGRWFGKTKLMPELSPNKTIAGAISGLLGSLLIGALAGPWLSTAPLPALMTTSVFAAFLAQNGDLFESLIKRVAHVKDSGRFMPGHGGVLDRLDGIFFAAPLVYALADFFKAAA